MIKIEIFIYSYRSILKIVTFLLKKYQRSYYKLIKKFHLQRFQKYFKGIFLKNPNINFNDFKNEGDKLCNEFSLGEHFYGNIYYIGGKISNTYKKFSVFINQKIFDDSQVIRDCK